MSLPCGLSLSAESGFLGAPEEPSDHIEATGFVQGKCLDPTPHAVGFPWAEHHSCLPACLSLPHKHGCEDDDQGELVLLAPISPGSKVWG